MRELSFVRKLKFNFNGTVTKRALVLGDADNDGRNELVCANLQGDLAIYKEKDCAKFAYACDLGMITACAIGDVMNVGRNFVVSINMEGCLFIFNVTNAEMNCSCKPDQTNSSATTTECEPYSHDSSRMDETPSPSCRHPKEMIYIYQQRMPANCKELLLADIDGDGQNELIIGLTDRVLRTYKWIDIGDDRGKFVGLYKWEFADQIGSVSLNSSRRENCLDIIVAQPGGTYARLECFDKKPTITPKTLSSFSGDQNKAVQPASSSVGQTVEKLQNTQDSLDIETDDANVKTEYISKLTPEYHQLAIAQMRNNHVSTEVLGGLSNGKGTNTYSSLVIATLDGTLMLVNKDEILWSLQVDHQLFALAVIETSSIPKIGSRSATLPQSESTCTIVPSPDFLDQTLTSSPEMSQSSEQPPTQYFAVCAWDGKTYIVDESRNYLRFKFDEAVSAFTAGNYYFDGENHTALVYATFNNQIVLYYDVVTNDIRPKYLLDEIFNNSEHRDLKRRLNVLAAKLNLNRLEDSENSDDPRCHRLYKVVHDILYGIRDEDISQ